MRSTGCTYCFSHKTVERQWSRGRLVSSQHVKETRIPLLLPGRFTHRGVKASGSCSGERGDVLTVGTYCYVAVGSAARGASAPTEGAEGRGILWRRLFLLV